MLEIEEIKKGAKFAEGFEYSPKKDGRPSVTFPDGQWTFLDYPNELFQLITYPLFLQRVIEGINNKGDYILEINHWCINIYNRHSYDLIKQFDFYEDIEGIDQAKEQAIKYILVKDKEC